MVNGPVVVVRQNTNSPLLPPSTALGWLVEVIVTTGSELGSLSPIVTTATLGETILEPGALMRVTTTVSGSSTVQSSTGRTGRSMEAAPAGMMDRKSAVSGKR